MAKNLAKATDACNAKTISNSSDFNTPWVIYNPSSSLHKVLYSVNGDLSTSNHFYDSSSGNEFKDCSE
jgi:hypothetical protein